MNLVTLQNLKFIVLLTKLKIRMTKKSNLNLTTTEVVKHLKGLLKHTNQDARVTKVKTHLREVEAAKKAKASLASTRIGATLESFGKVNASKNIDSASVFAFLYTRLLTPNYSRPTTQLLVEQGLKFKANKVLRISHAA